nr:YiiX/YebB-like N1pC/P60 family cysteine hydrolase [uncultured Cobetia sp.]
MRRGDVLLVEGSSRISTAIRYLTQSTWSHAALCVRTPLDTRGRPVRGDCLLEADVTAGVRRAPLNHYWHQHTRICRPVGLTEKEISALIAHAEARLGHQYDLRNIVDLARYLIRTPPVPSRYRRRMLALGSGDPTRAICSSLIAEAFQAVRYPILPDSDALPSSDPACLHCYQELLHIRHHSLFAPCDFDISPYFDIIKPTLCAGFAPHRLQWSEPPA